ncbi:hypothetical protein CRG98_005450 [Punica granatum]|uniref:Uncharacterized protein n=1 Tax=Punica granatum TaxID=22663 RepID=A0A2I0L0I9_PUNGR|nr:hypothetical protein CRG98_005450 [Punica granatum]
MAHSRPYFSCLRSFTFAYTNVGKDCTTDGSSPGLGFTTTTFTVGLLWRRQLVNRLSMKHLQRQTKKAVSKKNTISMMIRRIVRCGDE